MVAHYCSRNGGIDGYRLYIMQADFNFCCLKTAIYYLWVCLGNHTKPITSGTYVHVHLFHRNVRSACIPSF